MSTSTQTRVEGPLRLAAGPDLPAPRPSPEPRSPEPLPPSRRALAPQPAPRAEAARSWRGAARPRLLPSGRVAAPAEQRQRRGSTTVDHLLTVLAVLGLAVTGLTVAAQVSGLRPLVVRSGSMEPTLATGAMVLVRTVPATDVRVGDVVTVERPDGVRVTHRVLSAAPVGESVRLQLQGDANEAPDPDPVVVASAGRLVWSVPLLGRLAAELASARGGFLLGCLVTGGALSALRRPR